MKPSAGDQALLTARGQICALGVNSRVICNGDEESDGGSKICYVRTHVSDMEE